MQKIKPFILFTLLFGAIAFFSFKSTSEGYDGHKIGRWYINVPDSMPPYQGLYWTHRKDDTLTISPYNSREYQIEIDIDSSEIWDGDRLVGKIPYDSTSKLDLLINKDNE